MLKDLNEFDFDGKLESVSTIDIKSEAITGLQTL